MADNNLEITLTLNDQASGQAKAALDNVAQSANKAGVEGAKTTQTFEQGFRSGFRELRIFNEGLLILTGSIFGLNKVAQAWSEVNFETRQNMDSLSESAKAFSQAVGSLLGPSIQAISDAVKKSADGSKTWFDDLKSAYENYFKMVTFGEQFLISFHVEFAHGVSLIDAYKDSIKTAGAATEEMGKRFHDSMTQNIASTDAFETKVKQQSDAQKKLDELYLSGQITAQKYYQAITTGANQAISANQRELNLMKQMSEEEILLRNKSLQEDTKNTNAHMALLKTLESYHHTTYETMQAFENTVVTNFSSNMTTALTAIITGTQSASQAFKEFGLSMVTAIVNFVVEYGIQMLVAAALSKVVLAQTVTQAAITAAAWEPAAVFALIATLGGAAATVAPGLAVSFGAATAATAAQASISAGLSGISKAGSFDVGTSSVPQDMMALVHKDEIVVPPTFSDAIRNGVLSLSGGGNQQKSGGDTYIDIHVDRPQVTKQGDITSLVEEISRQLFREFQRIR